MFVSFNCLMMRIIGLGLIFTSLFPVLANAEEILFDTVRAGRQVSFEYTLRLDDQIVLDTNVDGTPLTYIHGLQQLMPGLENGLIGLKVGEAKKIIVQPDDGYGLIDENAYIEADKSSIPLEALKVGAIVAGRDSTGHPIYPRIKEISEDEVILDYNHSLAGKVLYFDVRVLEIKKLPAPVLEH